MTSASARPMTLTQKILAAHARSLPRPWVQVGDVLQISVDWTIASELAWNGMERTYSMLGRPKLHDKDRFFLAVDHTVDPVTLATDQRAQKLVQLSQGWAGRTSWWRWCWAARGSRSRKRSPSSMRGPFPSASRART